MQYLCFLINASGTVTSSILHPILLWFT